MAFHLDNNSIFASVYARATSKEDPVLGINHQYDLVLRDIINTMSCYPAPYNGALQFSLCPRWLDQRPQRRDVIVKTQTPSLLSKTLGTIRIEHKATYPRMMNGFHEVTNHFQLQFHSEEHRFISPQEFHSLSDAVLGKDEL